MDVKYPKAEAVSLSGKNGCDASWEVPVAAERGTGVAVTRIVRGTGERCMCVCGVGVSWFRRSAQM